MNKGIEILLERMKSNPDEFAYNANQGEGKWSGLLANFKHSFTEEEVTAIQEGIKAIERARFTELVMKELLDPKSETNPYLAPSATHLGGATPVRSSVALNNINTVGTWGSSSIEQTLARLEEIKKEYDKPKKPKTIFGRLFNYQ